MLEKLIGGVFTPEQNTWLGTTLIFGTGLTVTIVLDEEEQLPIFPMTVYVVVTFGEAEAVLPNPMGIAPALQE